jgi:hypothetical protein
MKDIYLEDFNEGKINYINNQQQRALNWVKLGNKQIFTSYGVDYYNYIQSDGVKYSININSLAVFIQQELSKNYCYCKVIPADTGSSTEIFNIEVFEDGI